MLSPSPGSQIIAAARVRVWNLIDYPFHFLNIASLCSSFISSIVNILLVKCLSLLLLLPDQRRLRIFIDNASKSLPIVTDALCKHTVTIKYLQASHPSGRVIYIKGTKLSLCLFPLLLRYAHNFNNKNKGTFLDCSSHFAIL